MVWSCRIPGFGCPTWAPLAARLSLFIFSDAPGPVISGGFCEASGICLPFLNVFKSDAVRCLQIQHFVPLNKFVTPHVSQRNSKLFRGSELWMFCLLP